MKELEKYLRRKGLPITLFIDDAIYTSAKKPKNKYKISHEGVIGFFYFLGKKLKLGIATKPQFSYRYNKKIRKLVPDIMWRDGKRMNFIEIELTSQKGVTRKIGNYIKYSNDQLIRFKNKKIPFPNLILFTNIYNFEDNEKIEYPDAKFPKPKNQLVFEHININPNDLKTVYLRARVDRNKRYKVVRRSKKIIKNRKYSNLIKKGVLY